METTKTAVGYIRVSTEEQVKSGLGLEDQRQRIHHWCAAMGVELLAVYEDAGVSGGTMDRPDMAKMRSDIKTGDRGRIDMVVVLKLDRCGRTTNGVLDFIAELRAVKCDFVSVTEGFDSGTAVGRMVLTMLAAFATFERDLTIERTCAALSVLRAQGHRTHRCPAYGFLALLEGGWMAVPNEITVVDRIFRMHYFENMGTKRIARTLENEGFLGFVPTKDRIRHILKNGFYLPLIAADIRDYATVRGELTSKPMPNFSTLAFDAEIELTPASEKRREKILQLDPSCRM